MKRILSALILTIIFFSAKGQNKIKLSEDTLLMRKEFLTHIPIGTDTADAIKILTENKFEYYSRYQNDEFLWHKNINYLFFYHEEYEILNTLKWQVAVVYDSKGKITDILVVFHVIGL